MLTVLLFVSLCVLLALYAAPTPTARVTPTGIKLEDGYQSFITLSDDPDIWFWEKSIQGAGFEGGDAIDITTMHNADWRTMAPRSLITMTEVQVTAAYDPKLHTEIMNQINRRQTITEKFPDGSTLCYFGFVKTFAKGELVEGTFPECTITIVPTNYDPVNRVEAAPVLTNVAGT